jgi:nucleotide-binding universal stress UspA family protein
MAGAVILAYDGSDLAKAAIAEAGRQLAPGREAIVVTVWQPVNVGFRTSVPLHAQAAEEVADAAARTAGEGASLAEAAGFSARGLAVEAAPTWQGIVDAADERDASLIVLGSHGHTGLGSVLMGSVATAVTHHSRGGADRALSAVAWDAAASRRSFPSSPGAVRRTRPCPPASAPARTWE